MAIQKSKSAMKVSLKKKVKPTIAKKKVQAQPATKKPAQKAAPKKKAVHDHAFRPGNHLVPLTAYAAKSTAIPGIVNSTLILGVAEGNRAMVIGTSAGTTGTAYAMIVWDNGGVAKTLHTPPVYALDGLNNGPTASKVMKHSIEVISNTNALKREGNVRALQLNSRLVFPVAPDVMTPAQWNDVFVKLFGLNDTVNIGCDALKRSTTLSGVPADTSAYERFRHFSVPGAVNTYFANFSEWPLLTDSVDYARPMSTQVWLFDSVTQQQTYTITGHLTSYCRYPVDTAAHLTSKDQTVAPAAELAKTAALTAQNPVISSWDGRGAIATV
jgi:hypothetical protein